jgi:solute carrier family 25 uncoupling protein 8/9
MVVRDEGVLALWKGLTPSLMRGMFFGGLRLGMYNPTKQWLADREAAASGGVPPSSVSMSTKVLAGTLSGTGAALVCSPTELLKVRPLSPNLVVSLVRLATLAPINEG